jgi:hypothetical protein
MPHHADDRERASLFGNSSKRGKRAQVRVGACGLDLIDAQAKAGELAQNALFDFDEATVRVRRPRVEQDHRRTRGKRTRAAEQAAEDQQKLEREPRSIQEAA